MLLHLPHFSLSDKGTEKSLYIPRHFNIRNFKGEYSDLSMSIRLRFQEMVPEKITEEGGTAELTVM